MMPLKRCLFFRIRLRNFLLFFLFWRQLNQISAIKHIHCKQSEDVINHWSCWFDICMINRTGRIEAGENKFLYKLFKWHTILQSDWNGDWKNSWAKERKDAPSLCISTNISPSVWSSYSPVRTKMVWPPTFAFWVNPFSLCRQFLTLNNITKLSLKVVSEEILNNSLGGLQHIVSR